VGDVAVRAAFGFQSVSTEIHCKTGVRVGKAKRAWHVAWNFAALPSCMQGAAPWGRGCSNERVLYFRAILFRELTK